MMEQVMAKIFLNEQRGVLEEKQLKSCMIFNCGSYYNEHKQPFKSLVLFNDETLTGGAQLTVSSSDMVSLILIPITGDLYFDDLQGGTEEVNVGEVKVYRMVPEKPCRITNPYASELVNFLQIRIREGFVEESMYSGVFGFDLLTSGNKLIGLSETSETFGLSIGQFEGRKEAVYFLKKRAASLFIFIISGVFEVEGRLLHPGDGLALWDIEKMEMEALSNYATILVLELYKD